MKKRATGNRIGDEGEWTFGRAAARNGLLPTKLQADVGVDFFCQVDLDPKSSGTSRVAAGHIYACVRSTKSDDGRITLDREDASVLLSADSAICVALIHLGKHDAFYYRFVDESFGAELINFLSSSRKTMSLTPRRCKPEAELHSDVMAMIQPGVVERIRLALAELRIGKAVPTVQVGVRREPGDQLTVVRSVNFYDYFRRLSDAERDQLYAATFGSPSLQQERLAGMALHDEVAAGLQGLPQPFVLAGFTEADECDLSIRTSQGKARCRFTFTSNGTHSGYVHEAGFALTISERRQEGDMWVHDLRAFPDPDVELDLLAAPDLLRFLALAEPGAMIRLRSGGEIEADSFGGLFEVSWFARYLRNASKLTGWSASVATLRDASHPETLDTMAWLSALAGNPTGVARLGLVEGDCAGCEEKKATWELPAVANTARASVIAWIACEGWLSVRGDGTACGLRVETVLGVEIDVVDRITKSSTDPEYVLSDTLVIGQGHKGWYRTSSNAAEWPCAMSEPTFIDE